MLPLLNTGLEQLSFISRPSEKDIFVIFVHPLQSGLFQIKLQGPSGKYVFSRARFYYYYYCYLHFYDLLVYNGLVKSSYFKNVVLYFSESISFITVLILNVIMETMRILYCIIMKYFCYFCK